MLTTLGNYLQYATPESQGIASAAILQFVEAVERQIQEFHSFMLLRHGKVVAEGWWSPYGREHPHMLFSLSKSFTSTAVGLAMAEGRFSIDDSVLSFFPDEAPTEISEHLAAMRVRHLLSMSTGHAVDTIPPMFEQLDGQWTKGFFEVPVVHEPGTHFLYNTGATYMLSAIVQKTTGMKLVDYLESRLFQPLGIENAVWEESPQGINTGGFGLSIKTEGIAAFGQLYLQKGIWAGNRILPESWVEEATAFQVANGNDPKSDWAQGYGYQFWRCQHNAYRGDGAFGQYCIVMPEQDAILAITGGMPDMQVPLNVVWDILLPAMQADALPDNAEAQNQLTEKLSNLALPLVQGEPSSPVAEMVSNRTYSVDPNELNIETIKLNFSDAGCVVTMKKEAIEESIPCAYGNWQKDETHLFNEPWRLEPIRTAASCAWTAEATFTIIIRLYETPFFHTFVCRFAEDQLTIEARINVAFEPPKTQVLVAYPIS
ncbi:MAG: serine hydrolase [Anaerolineae bacterium]|nr:serine hydrolase [Anaerolineae bacterium]